MRHFKKFADFLNEAAEGSAAKKLVKGSLKKYIFIYDRERQEIGCKFSRFQEEEIDDIESDDDLGKVFTSTQISDKGVRPIEMKYAPCKGVSWEKFVETLEAVFDEYTPQ